MPRYIDADEFIALYKIMANDDRNKKAAPISWSHAFEEVIDDAEEMPTADVEPVRHGQWIECDYKRLEHGMIETYPNAGYACSVCRTGFDKKKMTYKQYCPHCGAKMDGDNNG